jgi:hypothetical protein
MRRAALAAAAVLGLAAARAPAQDDALDRLSDALSFSGWNDTVRVHLSGTLDLEGYYQSETQTGLIFSERDAVLAPRLSLFADAQLGPLFYAFVQARADNGFDPNESGAGARVDEALLRFSPFGDGRLSFQAGKFATVVGNWTERHGSWENPFITAPLPYENLTGIWDTTAAHAPEQVLYWAGVLPHPNSGGALLDEYRSLPVIWGPSYASGAAAMGALGPLTFALEVKNDSLSSRPETWPPGRTQWQEPTVSGRLGYSPDEMWSFGVSASDGVYLGRGALQTLDPGQSLSGYREVVLGEDASFAWHRVQVWAEAYEARFEIPGVGDADTVAYYVEGKVKLTPQFFGALRWNQQFFSSLPGEPGERWGRATTRVDVGPCYRFTPHLETKIQFSLERQAADLQRWSTLSAVQVTARF